MKDTASEPLALYIFGKTLCKPHSHQPYKNLMLAADRIALEAENPKFRAALWRYYQDTISYGGALQFFPRCLEGYNIFHALPDLLSEQPLTQ